MCFWYKIICYRLKNASQTIRMSGIVANQRFYSIYIYGNEFYRRHLLRTLTLV